MTIFERIVAGEIPCFKVAEDANHLAFLDIKPVAPGHTLVVPKRVVDHLFDMDEHHYVALLDFSRLVARHLRATISCERICMSVVGFEVPHAHIHLIPARSISDFPWPGGHSASNEELSQMAMKLRM